MHPILFVIFKQLCYNLLFFYSEYLLKIHIFIQILVEDLLILNKKLELSIIILVLKICKNLQLLKCECNMMQHSKLVYQNIEDGIISYFKNKSSISSFSIYITFKSKNLYWHNLNKIKLTVDFQNKRTAELIKNKREFRRKFLDKHASSCLT
ncbi:hypothetical protein BpHYR1_021495 [Brachionus plicatilis]|uniref:Uncharacterized protein n=1 Tax=Brachionus plicatilis TaxID=10195 RepID=A0A3M7T2V0_BRAPC|nr:hypothetical protein BpHYR1_021495 [Brachionus plicatilis]